MKYLHIKNLEKFNPGYEDRTLIWCKAYFKMLNADPEFEMLCEIDKWRFIAFVMLELQVKKQIPLNEEYLIRKGFDFKTRSLDLTIESLKESIEIMTDLMQPVEINDVTEELKDRSDSVTQSRVEKSRKEKSRLYVDFEKSTTELWNSFCINYPSLSRITEVSEKRRAKLKKRFEKESFRNFQSVLDAIVVQKFLMGDNKSNWKVSFDWLIDNDTNYLKVLEFKYGKNASEDAGFSAKWRNDALK